MAVSLPPVSPQDESAFWALLHGLPGTPDAALSALEGRLRGIGEGPVRAFHARLCLVLRELDRRDLAVGAGGAGSLPSGDAFLSARCAAVLRGHGYVQACLAEPRQLDGDAQAQELLFLPSDVLTRARSEGAEVWLQPPVSLESPVSFESFDNPEGWPDGAPALGPSGAPGATRSARDRGRSASVHLLGPVFLLWGALRVLAALSWPELSPAVADATAGTLGGYVFSISWGPLRALPPAQLRRWRQYLPGVVFYGVITGSAEVRLLLDLSPGGTRAWLVGGAVGLLCAVGLTGGLLLGARQVQLD